MNVVWCFIKVITRNQEYIELLMFDNLEKNIKTIIKLYLYIFRFVVNLLLHEQFIIVISVIG